MRFLLRRLRNSAPLALLSLGAATADLALLAGLRSFLSLLSPDWAPSRLQEWLPGPSSQIHGTQWSALAIWVIAMLCLAGLRFVLLRARLRESDRLLVRAELYWRLLSLRAILKAPADVFHAAGAGGVASRLVEAVRSRLSGLEARHLAVSASFQLAVFLPVLFLISPMLATLLLLVLLPLLSWLQRRVHALSRALDSAVRDRAAFAFRLGQWAQLVRSYRGPSRTAVGRRLFWSWRSEMPAHRDLARRRSTVVAGAELFSAAATVLVLASAALLVRLQWLAPMDLVLFCAALFLSYRPSRELGRLLPALREARNAEGYMRSLMVASPAVVPKSLSASAPEESGSAGYLIVDGLHFAYEGGGEVFSGYSATIPLDRPIFLRAPNGSGKTTLLRLMAGLEIPTQGRILVPDSIREHGIAYLGAEAIFPDVQRSRSVSPELCALLSPRPAESVGVLGGERVSTGQRQRMALAWMASLSAGLLLLDEPATALPHSARSRVLQLLWESCRERGAALVVASHDPAPDGLACHVMELPCRE